MIITLFEKSHSTRYEYNSINIPFALLQWMKKKNSRNITYFEKTLFRLFPPHLTCVITHFENYYAFEKCLIMSLRRPNYAFMKLIKNRSSCFSKSYIMSIFAFLCFLNSLVHFEKTLLCPYSHYYAS